METAIDKAIAIIENSNLFKNHGYDRHWISGSSTVVYPIAVWHPSKEIVIQMDRDKYRGRTQATRKLIKDLTEVIPIKGWHYNPNDGSCPPELTIWYEE